MERRVPRPWWFRLVGWVIALALLATLAVLIVDRGSYGATEHTVARTAAPALDGEPAASVVPQGSYPEGSYLAGPVIANITEHGVVALDPDTGQTLWQYLRSDTTVCAHRTNAQHVTLVYASGDRCDEAVSLKPADGTRQWQRTLEAVHPNRIVWDEGVLISIDPSKVIVFEDGQGFERFTLDNSKTDHIAGEHTSCENLDAAGSSMVATLQRCRASTTEPWLYQVVVNEASDGQPRETGRSYLTRLTEPTVEGVSPNGTAILRDADGVVYSLTLGASEPQPIAGIATTAPDQPLDVVASRGTILVSAGSTTYSLNPSRTAVSWSTPIVALPYAFDIWIYVPTASGIEVRSAVDGQLARTIVWSASTTPPAEIVVSGPLIGVRDAAGLQVYA